MAKSKAIVPPTSVISPKQHWTLISVLKVNDDEGTALAIGRWDKDAVLAMRWNGSEKNPIGHPQSRGLPVWFVVPNEYHEAILSAAKLSADKTTLVRNFLPAPCECGCGGTPKTEGARFLPGHDLRKAYAR